MTLCDPLLSLNATASNLVFLLIFPGRPCYKENLEQTVLDRFVRPVAECLTPEVAHQIVNLQLDSHSQERLDEQQKPMKDS